MTLPIKSTMATTTDTTLSIDSPRTPDPKEFADDWDNYFHRIAEAVSQKSKDPKSRVGAVIVSPDRLILSTGFNGLARGLVDDNELLNNVDEKLKWICHAEMNAIFNAARIGVGLAGCRVYVNKFPCLTCLNAILQAGITDIYTLDHKYWSNDPIDEDHSRKRSLLLQSGIRVHAPNHPEFTGGTVTVERS